MRENMKFEFMPASRKKLKARIAITGAYGAGKTYTALEIATGLANGGQIAVIDSMGGQSCIYASDFHFAVVVVDTHSPEIYANAIKAAAAQGFAVVVVDTISSAWNGQGGALALVDQSGKQDFGGNNWSGWSKVTPLQLGLYDAMLKADCHVIVTVQTKVKHVLETNARGKQVPVPVGMESVQRDGFDYIPDITIYMDHEHTGTIIKTRYAELDKLEVNKPDRKLATFILDQLNKGEEPGEDHWSDSFRNRTYILGQLDKLDIPQETLFACYGANGWIDLKAVPLPENGSRGIIQAVAEYYADNP